MLDKKSVPNLLEVKPLISKFEKKAKIVNNNGLAIIKADKIEKLYVRNARSRYEFCRYVSSLFIKRGEYEGVFE